MHAARLFSLVTLTMTLALAGCSSDAKTPDAAVDARISVDTGEADTAIDAARDSAVDVAVDATDAGPASDATLDGGADGASDAIADGSPDATPPDAADAGGGDGG